MTRVVIYLAILLAATLIAIAGIYLGYIVPLEGAGLLAATILALVLRLVLHALRPRKSDRARL